MARIEIKRPQIQRPAAAQRPQIQRTKPRRIPPGMALPNLETMFDPDDNPLADLSDTGDIEENADIEVDITLAELLAARRSQKELYRVTNGDEFWFAVCFQSQAQKDDFLHLTGWADLGDKYLDGLKVSARLGVPVEPILLERPKPARKPVKKGGE